MAMMKKYLWVIIFGFIFLNLPSQSFAHSNGGGNRGHSSNHSQPARSTSRPSSAGSTREGGTPNHSASQSGAVRSTAPTTATIPSTYNRGSTTFTQKVVTTNGQPFVQRTRINTFGGPTVRN